MSSSFSAAVQAVVQQIQAVVTKPDERMPTCVAIGVAVKSARKPEGKISLVVWPLPLHAY